MNRSIYLVELMALMALVGLGGALGCSAAGGGVGARTSAPAPAGPESGAATAPSPSAQASAKDTPRPTAVKAPLEYHDETDADRVFIENAERAIAQYTEFLARAGDNPEYAVAAKRSREQIEDLQATLVFVRKGAAQRAAH